MKRSRLLFVIALIIIALSVSACAKEEPAAPAPAATPEPAAPAAPEPAAEVKVLTIGTGDVGGSLYPIGSTIAKIINDKVPGLKVNVETTGGSVDNSRMVGENELDMGLSAGDTAYLALQGESMFDGNAQKDLRTIFAYNQSTSIWFVPESAGINSIPELAGKKIVTGMPGSGTEQGVSFVLPLAGIDYPSAITPLYIGVQEGCDAVRNGQADAFFGLGGMPQGAILDLANSIDIKFLPYSDDLLDKITSERPYYFKTTLPAGMFKGQDEDVPTFGVKSECLINANADEEMVYQITKAIWENIETMYEGHSSLKYMTEDFVASDLTVPLHPGAERYWKEIGIID